MMPNVYTIYTLYVQFNLQGLIPQPLKPPENAASTELV